MGFIEELVDELREVFSIDKDFSEKKFEKQMAVVRGQALNLASAMRFDSIPRLTYMTRVYAVKNSKLQNMTEPVTYSKSAG